MSVQGKGFQGPQSHLKGNHGSLLDGIIKAILGWFTMVVNFDKKDQGLHCLEVPAFNTLLYLKTCPIQWNSLLNTVFSLIPSCSTLRFFWFHPFYCNFCHVFYNGAGFKFKQPPFQTLISPCRMLFASFVHCIEALSVYSAHILGIRQTHAYSHKHGKSGLCVFLFALLEGVGSAERREWWMWTRPGFYSINDYRSTWASPHSLSQWSCNWDGWASHCRVFEERESIRFEVLSKNKKNCI